MIILIYIRNVKLFNLNHHIYVSHRMGTISLCIVGLPICEFLPIPACMRMGSPRMRTGSPRMRTAIGFDLWGEMHLSHEKKGARTWGKEHAGP